MKIVLRLAAWLTIAITVGIVIALIIPAVEFFTQVSITDFLFGTRWRRRDSPTRHSVSSRW